VTFTDVVKSIPGLTHYYPLATDAKDVVGTKHGTASGVTFANGRAVFNGKASINLGDSDDFSVATNKGLSVVLFLTIDDWKGAGASEYVHWAGKGVPNAHEWTFRHYVKGGTGEASTRQGRTSFYHYNPAGGLGAGSYYQDSTFPTNERVFVGRCDLTNVSLAVEGTVRDTDPLSGYSIVPKNTGSSVFLGTRGDNTGFLVGKIRRVAFYDRVLTAAEIKTIYDARAQADDAPVLTPPPVVTPPAVDPLIIPAFASSADTINAHNALVKALRDKGTI
jgi:hypothetical protein